jgi:Zn-dependent protease with chaperone function
MPGAVPARRAVFERRPPRYPSASSWLLAGMTRNPRGTAAALLCAWLNVPLAIFGALAGAVVGAWSGFLGGGVKALGLPGVDAMPGQVFQIGGMIGAIVGAAVGLVSGFLVGLFGPWYELASADLAKTIVLLIVQLAAGLTLGVLYTVYHAATEGVRLRIAGARRLSRREAEFLMPIVHECAHRLGLTGLPKVLIDDRRDVNAYAATLHIVVRRGLLEEFGYDREVVAGVVAHELGHWNNADPIARAFARGVALPLYVTFGVAAWLFQAFRHPVVQLALWAVAWPILITVRYIVVPLQAADARAAEYRADQAAVSAGHRAGIRRCLSRIRHTIDAGQTGWDEAICRSHPATELRLEALEEPGGTYPLPDEDAPPRPLPVMVAQA